MSHKILLVEGENDQKFFRALFKVLGLDVDVKVNTPKDHGAERNGKMAAFALLEELIKQLFDGSVTHLAMVIDADYSADSWGYSNTLKHIKKRMAHSNYNDPIILHSGLSFPHSDGLNDFGLWIMPDNASEGMLEDWIATAVKSSESPLLQHATEVVKNLPKPQKFKSIHTSKAKIATWMAWQKLPGEGLYYAIQNDLIDKENKSAKQLIAWLKHIYTQ